MYEIYQTINCVHEIDIVVVATLNSSIYCNYNEGFIVR